MRRVSYRGAEQLALVLARILEAEIPELLENACFIGIPRGGHVVLGLLSYALRLRPEQFFPSDSGPLVVVDDCLLSGARTRRLLERLPQQEIVLAHLLSVPEARRVVRQEEPRIRKCLAAADLETLRDLDPQEQAKWRKRLGGRGYWCGLPEDIVFPWSEPDRVFWNAREARMEPGWHKIPPHECLKHLTNLGMPISSWPSPEVQLRAGVEWRLEGDSVLLWETQSDEVFRLDKAAAAMLKASLAFGHRDAALEYLTAQFDAPAEEIETDLDEFLQRLRQQKLLAD